MTEKFTNITIETLILVAVWTSPFVFQGCFKLSSKLTNSRQFLYFRCECDKADKRELLGEGFSPEAYQFTHLYRGAQLTPTDLMSEPAIYLLKYALHTTLGKMIANEKHAKTVMDEVALEAIATRIEPILLKGSWIGEDNEIGFAVAMDFNPSESLGQAAVLALLGSEEFANNEEGYLLH